MPIRCRWPPDSLTPRSPTKCGDGQQFVPKPRHLLDERLLCCHRCRAVTVMADLLEELLLTLSGSDTV